MTTQPSAFVPSRRQVLIGAAATTAAFTTATAFAGTDTPLKDLAAAKGMRFGSAAGIRNSSFEDARVRDILVRECNLIVPENELKMYAIHPAADTYTFDAGDKILAFCESHHMAMRGHNLFWAKDEFTPKWLLTYDFGPKPKVAAEALLRAYIGKVADHFGTRLTSWDVINETVDEKTGVIRSNVFTRILGQDALRVCFEAAREHLPHMQLVYNDYMGWEAGDEAHRKGVLELLHWFRDHKVPVDALGIQGHIGTDHDLGAGQAKEWTAFLDEVVAMDYGLLVTEFDVNDRHVPGTPAQRDAVVAQVARDYLDIAFSYRQLKDMLCWGIADNYSWLQKFTPRDDKAPLRPTPYDADYAPKPLREAIAAAFKAAPAR